MNDNYINEQVLLEREPLPCAFSVDEVKERLRSTESDALTGVGLTTEEMLRTNKVFSDNKRLQSEQTTANN